MSGEVPEAMSGKVPQLATAMMLMIDTFDKYAKKDDNADSLSKGELSELFKAELGDIGSGDKAGLDEFFKGLDENKDGTICFQEFMIFTAEMTMITQEMTKDIRAFLSGPGQENMPEPE